jgi:hypothetical protein
MATCVEVRSYDLKPGSFDCYARLFAAEVLPLLRRWGHEVVFAGASLHGADTFVLIRAYESEADRAAKQDQFYGSADWREGPRGAVLALIEAFTSAVLPMSEGALDGWRRELAGDQAAESTR